MLEMTAKKKTPKCTLVVGSYRTIHTCSHPISTRKKKSKRNNEETKKRLVELFCFASGAWDPREKQPIRDVGLLSPDSVTTPTAQVIV